MSWHNYNLAMLVIASSFLFGALILEGLTESNLRAEAIRRGFAQYSPITGDWEWLNLPCAPQPMTSP